MSKPIVFGIGAVHRAASDEIDDWDRDWDRLAAETARTSATRQPARSPAAGSSAGLQVDRTTFVEGVRRGAVASRQTQAIAEANRDGSWAQAFQDGLAQAVCDFEGRRLKG